MGEKKKKDEILIYDKNGHQVIWVRWKRAIVWNDGIERHLYYQDEIGELAFLTRVMFFFDEIKQEETDQIAFSLKKFHDQWMKERKGSQKGIQKYYFNYQIQEPSMEEKCFNCLVEGKDIREAEKNAAEFILEKHEGVKKVFIDFWDYPKNHILIINKN